MSEIPPQEGETGKEGGGSADGGDLTVNVGSVNRSTTEDFNPEKEKALGAHEGFRAASCVCSRLLLW
ncbi:MAG TPA: hypothetical protein VEO74_05625 [Thermoanaerobaculia bacterium]|nr:hypothetical protein [Thermoanaerobaculia bacterium]